jgi:hypothetical protein
MRNYVTRCVLTAALMVWAVSTASADVSSAQLVIKQGDVLGPSTVSSLNTPFTDGNGKVGFVGALADSERFIWWGAGPVFYSNDALPDVLTGGESTMGVSNTGGFIYSPSVNGNDAVYTQGGALLQRGDPIPPLPGLYSAFNSRPTMLPNGTAYWVGGSTPTQGSSSATNRHLFMATDPTNPATITRVLGGGDVIDGKTVVTASSNFTYWISDNGAHHSHVLDMDVAGNQNLYVDGSFVAEEGGPTGQGDNWAAFDVVGVNNAGNYIFTGNTNGSTATDEYLAYDGSIAVREGDTLDGHTLLTGFTMRAASINNLNQVVHMWGSGTDEHLFFGDGTDLANSIQLLQTGDEIDVTGDNIADYQVTDFQASTVIGPGLSLAEDGWVYLETNMIPVGGGSTINAIIGLQVPEPATGVALALAALMLRRRR